MLRWSVEVWFLLRRDSAAVPPMRNLQQALQNCGPRVKRGAGGARARRRGGARGEERVYSGRSIHKRQRERKGQRKGQGKRQGKRQGQGQGQGGCSSKEIFSFQKQCDRVCVVQVPSVANHVDRKSADSVCTPNFLQSSPPPLPPLPPNVSFTGAFSGLPTKRAEDPCMSCNKHQRQQQQQQQQQELSTSPQRQCRQMRPFLFRRVGGQASATRKRI
mmetsp:Transcript_81222/g.169684  ORF Transcript_81222/g.169684 Transcript_81222/m.169684 type:complete len:217 (-) Transcript_81222:361-1011(-)